MILSQTVFPPSNHLIFPRSIQRVISGAIIILLVAVVWFFVIVGLNIAGQKRVGFLAGRFEQPDPTAEQIVGASSDEYQTLAVIEEEQACDSCDNPLDLDAHSTNSSAVAFGFCGR